MRELAMNWSNIDELLGECMKGATPAGTLPPLVPAEHAEVLRRYNGLEGFVGGEYLMMWSADQIEELNTGYSVSEYLPGVVLIGTNGSGTGFGMAPGGSYVRVPLVGMSPDETVPLGASFEEFLERLASGAGII